METFAVIAPRASSAERARAEICRPVGEHRASVATVARGIRQLSAAATGSSCRLSRTNEDQEGRITVTVPSPLAVT
jgi:hypothetical protein